MGGESSFRLSAESSFRLSTFLLILYLCNPTISMSCIESERAALLKLKQSLTDPSHMLSSWTGADCCNWTGVSCSSKHRGRVVRLNLGNMSLGGEISPSLLKLQQLRSLNLSMNNFGGIQIPGFFGSITNLKYLDLSNANFGSKVPHQLGNLSSLLYLHLGSDLDFRFPNLLQQVGDLGWISGLSSLTYLDMRGVSFSMSGSSWFEAINKIPSLKVLHLLGCSIDSINPPSLPFFNLTSLSVLNLAGNYINSTLPGWLSNTTHLTTLDLYGNDFTGPIPDAFGKMTSLSYLDLSLNQLEGEILPSFGNLCSLRSLNLRDNNISGGMTEFMDSLSRCYSINSPPNITVLDLAYNSISGPIPSSIEKFSSLQQIWLDDNQLTGTVPVSIGQLSMLTSLYISRNPLEGVLSEDHFADLTSLVDLFVSDTALTFEVSSNWDPPFLLRRLDLSSTPAGPSLPPWLRTQKGLKMINLYNTSISGELPHWFWGLTSNADVVDLSNNQLMGSLPSSLVHNNFTALDLSSNQLSGNLPPFNPAAIQKLNLRNNKFSGTLPHSICEMNNMVFLGLTENHIYGSIPDCWTSSQNIATLDLGSNSLSGGIPESLGSLASSLVSLHLNQNNLTGELPTSLKRCTKLNVVDLSQNSLSGSIPSWVGESLPNLIRLQLRSNMFTGGIPQSLFNLSSLVVLDLANNRLSGVIPSAFANLTAMIVAHKHDTYYGYYFNGRYSESVVVYAKGRELDYINTLGLVTSLDLSNNRLLGEIPKELTTLLGLIFLNLSDNRLGGPIPKEIGKLRWLESLDLSRNNLLGTIPPSITALNFLSKLNLSYNKLMGEIPQGFQIQTLDDPSIYIGNDGLCGHPLLVTCDSPHEPPSIEVGRGDEDDASDIIWFYSGIAPGFAVGFVGIWSVLFLKNSWRYRIFKFTDDANDWIYVTTVLKVNRLRRRFGKHGGSL